MNLFFTLKCKSKKPMPNNYIFKANMATFGGLMFIKNQQQIIINKFI